MCSGVSQMDECVSAGLSQELSQQLQLGVALQNIPVASDCHRTQRNGVQRGGWGGGGVVRHGCS